MPNCWLPLGVALLLVRDAGGAAAGIARGMPLRRIPRARSAMLPDATASSFAESQPEHERVVLAAKVALETAQAVKVGEELKLEQLKLEQLKAGAAMRWDDFVVRVSTVILITCAVVVGQSAITSNWLTEFVRIPLQSLITAGFAFMTLIVYRGFVWLQGEFKKDREDIKALGTKVGEDIKALDTKVGEDIKEVRKDIKEGIQALNQRFDSFAALIINTLGATRISSP